jgi:hypothetical protein
MAQRVLEELTIDGQPIFLEHVDLPLESVELDQDNPRIRYRLSLAKNGKTLPEVILALPEVTKLRKDIELNRGLRERIIVKRTSKGKFKAVEGNCRTVCYGSLAKKHPDDAVWKAIPARVLPDDVSPKHVAILLSDLHVAGKIEWKAHEKAGQVYRMREDLEMTFDDISTYLRQSKTTTIRLYKAYAFMQEHFLTIDSGKFAKQGEGKWSFFDELFRSKELRDQLERKPGFGDDFCRWVGNGNLPDGMDVRILPAILKHPEARKRFEKGAPLSEVKRIIDEADPEQGSDFFKLLAKLRESCTSAAQVKEILRIRSDKNARKRVLETYEAFVDFMRLADIDVATDQMEKAA